MASGTVEITGQNFKEVVERDGIVLIDWWAPWCGPCRVFGPTYEKVAQKHPDITFGKVNTEEEQRLAATFGIRSIPTLMVFRDGILLLAQPGVVPAPALDEIVGKVKALDMDEIRNKIAEQEEQPESSES